MMKSLLVILLFCFFVNHNNIFAEKINEDFKTEELKFFIHRCTLCHGIERIYLKEKKKPWEWASLVSWMQDKLPDVLNDDDIKKIVSYLSTDKYLYEYRCTKCHSLERVYEKNYEYKKWEEIVVKMQKKDPRWIRDDEVSRIAFYISDNNKIERNKLEHEMVRNLIFLEKNIGVADLTKLLHSAESLNSCANGLCKFPPLVDSDEFAGFVDNLKEITEQLKKNIKGKNIEQSLEDVKKVRKACGECHGALNK